MKKQLLVLATITTFLFISCSKEKIEAPQTNQSEEIAGAMSSANKAKGGSTLENGLAGRFEFDGNLNDKTNQLAPGVSTVGRVIYTTDRKGNINSAIKFNEAYGVDLHDVPVESNMTLSVWVKKNVMAISTRKTFIQGVESFYLAQNQSLYETGAFNGQIILSPSVDMNWHHLLVTRDGTVLKFYIDGNFVQSVPMTGASVSDLAVSSWYLGYNYNSGFVYWGGCLDDLRIYKRVVTGAEIQALSKF